VADDALTSIVLATEAPQLLAPAMNGKMWMHPATVANVAILKQRDSTFIGPVKGMLACDYEGIGVSGRSTTSSPKRLNTRSADAQHARQRKQ
jgi:phosphopantothenoylcysteine synthetase/decarboxylase